MMILFIIMILFIVTNIDDTIYSIDDDTIYSNKINIDDTIYSNDDDTIYSNK